jgi:sulfur carrier protein
MKVVFNDLETETEEDCTLSFFLTAQNLNERQGIAVAINGRVVPRKQWSEYLLNPKDEILVIKATQGG